MKWPCRCDCIWTVSCSWACVGNEERTNGLNHCDDKEENDGCLELLNFNMQNARELPALPCSDELEGNLGSINYQMHNKGSSQPKPDFWASIENVKQYGWYWGPVSGDAAEKLLNGEPDGSFLVRDSSDDHYIFSLSFKLNGHIRHVRIEHDQGKTIYLMSLLCKQSQM